MNTKGALRKILSNLHPNTILALTLALTLALALTLG